MSLCAVCGASFQQRVIGPGRRKLYCSKKCSKWAENRRRLDRDRGSLPPKRCAVCGALIAGGTRRSRFCSPECQREERRAAERAAYRRDGPRGNVSPCSRCGKPVGNRPRRPQVTCQDCRRVERVPYGPRPGRVPKPALDPRVCELCEETYVPKWKPRPGSQQRWCSKSCTTAWANGARPPYRKGDPVTRKEARNRLRQQVHAETYDGVTNKQILERDRWRCGICGKRIGKSFRWPHPRSASIDHVIPLSQGGDDTAANKRAAHLACNCGRMNRGGGEQLAMIG